MMQQPLNSTSLIKYQPEIDITASLQSSLAAVQSSIPTTNNPLAPEVVLNNMLPPRIYHDQLKNRDYLQYVGQTGKREDVERLKENITQELMGRNAVPVGICSVRQHIFRDTFDQLIRQVTIDNPERGMLLMRVRDQSLLSVFAHVTRYQEGLRWGCEKIIAAEENLQSLEMECQRWESLKADAQLKILKLNSIKETVQAKIKERKAVQGEKRQKQMQKMAIQTSNLSQFLNTIKNK